MTYITQEDWKAINKHFGLIMFRNQSHIGVGQRYREGRSMKKVINHFKQTKTNIMLGKVIEINI